MKPTPLEMAPEDGSLVEVTLQNLSGLTCRLTNNGTRFSIPNVTAAVGFSGSATDMQVSSSFLCGTSGNVLVQSQAVHSQQPVGDVDNPSTCALVAEWHGTTGGSVNRSFSSSSSSSSSSARSLHHQPHLTIRLPKRDPKLPSVPLSRMNRDCNVVHDDMSGPPSLDESETSSHQTTPHGVAEDNKSEARGASVVWSASGAAMPEIIELHVSLIMDADHHDGHSEYEIPLQQTTFQVGVAHLVFYGSDDGTTVLDLPIKKQLAEHSSFEHPAVMMTVDDDAFLRVCVTVSVNGQKQLNSPSPQSLPYTNDVETLEPILQQLRIAHDDHQRELRRQKLKQANEKNLEDQKLQMEIEQPGGFFCSGDMGVLDILKSFSNTIRQCDDGEGVLHRSDSMGSTIVTSASLGI